MPTARLTWVWPIPAAPSGWMGAFQISPEMLGENHLHSLTVPPAHFFGWMALPGDECCLVSSKQDAWLSHQSVTHQTRENGFSALRGLQVPFGHPLWAPMCFLLRRGSRQRVKARVFWNVLLSPLKSSVAPAIRFLVTPLTKALLSCPDGSVWMVGQPQEESCWFRTSSTYRSWTLHCCHWDLNMFCSLPPVSV